MGGDSTIISVPNLTCLRRYANLLHPFLITIED